MSFLLGQRVKIGAQQKVWRGVRARVCALCRRRLDTPLLPPAFFPLLVGRVDVPVVILVAHANAARRWVGVQQRLF